MRVFVVAGFLITSTLPAFAPAGLILAENYGVIADGAFDNLAKINDVIDACRTLNPIAKGCAVQWPTGPIALNGTPQDIDYGPKWSGTGAGAIQALPGGRIDKSGTTFVQLCKTCDTFRFSSLDGPTLKDFGMSMPLDATDGTAIWIRPAVTPVNYQEVIHPFIENVRFIGGWNHIACNLCTEGAINDTVHWSARMHAITMFNSAAFSDAGDFSIRGAKFWFLMPGPMPSLPTGSCITLATSGGIMISDFKMLGCSIGVHVIATQGRTGTLMVHDGSLEEVKVAGVKFEQQGPGCFGYGNVNVHDVQMANGGSPTYEGGVVLAQGICGAHYIDYVNMHHLTINISYTPPINQPPFFFTDIDPATPPIPARCISAMDGFEVMIDHVRCNAGNTPGYGGIKVGGYASRVILDENRIINTGSLGAYEIGVPSILLDHSTGLSVANIIPYASFLAAGSKFYLVDGHSTSWPTNLAVTSGGVGCDVTVSGATGGNFVCAQP